MKKPNQQDVNDMMANPSHQDNLDDVLKILLFAARDQAARIAKLEHIVEEHTDFKYN